MFRALLFAIKVGLVAAAAMWVVNRPGEAQLDWLGYHITMHVGVVLLGLLVILLFILALHRMVLAIAALPKSWKTRRKKGQQEKGYQSLTQGLTAVAAGDCRQATDKADKVRQLWPQDKGLSLLLEAQAARLRGEEDVARSAFQKLLQNKDTAFLGLRGLLANALESGDTKRALELAQQAQKMHPREPWIIKMVYDLEIQEKQWQLADQTLKRAQRFKAIDEKQAKSDGIVMLLARAEKEQNKEGKTHSLKYLKAAHKADPAFVPAAQWLAAAYIERGKKHLAKAVLERTWKENPHIDLIPLWDQSAPKSKKADGAARLRWFEKLVSLKPDSAEGQLAAAQVALEQQLWGEARQYLNMAEQLQPSATLYRLYAQLEDALGHIEDSRIWFEKASEAPPDKVWVCKETGHIYESWSPIAKPHGSFNTIIWDYPRARAALTSQALLPQNELLITAK